MTRPSSSTIEPRRCPRVAAVLLLLCLVFGTGPAAGVEQIEPARDDRCPVCGMFTAEYPDFAARVTFSDDASFTFDGPKDMFTFLLSLAKYAPGRSRSGVEQVVVTEYYELIAIDAGTTGVRSRAVFTDGHPSVGAYREFPQIYPEPGWVEHDANAIWAAARDTLAEVVAAVGSDSVAAIGITNQRETVLAWNRSTGVPYGNAIVWQDRRTAARCEELAAQGHLPLVRERTGLVLDPYFSGTKAEWLLANRDITVDDDLVIGTIDAWLVWNLTGGEVVATDVSNASRTMLCDIRTRTWDPDLCALLHVPVSALPEIVLAATVTVKPEMPPP